MRESKGEDKTSMEHIIKDEMEIVATEEDTFYELVAEQKKAIQHCLQLFAKRSGFFRSFAGGNLPRMD